MSYQSFAKGTGTITDGYVLTYRTADGYWKPAIPQTLNPVNGFALVTTDISTSSSTYSEILTQNVSLPADGYVLVIFTFAGEKTTSTGTVNFRLKIDGIEEENLSASNEGGFATTGSIVYRKQLASGSHTFSIDWKVDTNGFRIFAATFSQHANLYVQQIFTGTTASNTSSAIDSSAQLTTIVDNVAGNGSYPSTNATNWTGSYTADGYSRLIIFGSATGGMSGSGNPITLNLKIDGNTVRSVTRYANTNGIHVCFPALVHSVILTAGSHTLALEQSGANSFSNSDSYANLYVYKVANVTNIAWSSTKTSNFGATSADTYIAVDTTSNAVTITLPSSPDNGERHIIADVGGVAATNNIIVNGGGHNIIGSSTYTITGPYNVLEVAYHAGKAIWVII